MKKTSKRTGASPKRSPVRRRAKKRQRRPREPAPDAALAAFADFAKRRKLRWYVFGAQAVNLHGFPRTTADLDITVDLENRAAADFVLQLARSGFALRFSDPEFVRTTRVIAVVHESTGLPIDLVLAGPGLEQRFLDEVELQTIRGRDIPVLSRENLVVTKLLAGRPKDLEDVRELIAMRPLDHARIDAILGELEDALGQSDLRALYDQLRREAAG